LPTPALPPTNAVSHTSQLHTRPTCPAYWHQQGPSSSHRVTPSPSYCIPFSPPSIGLRPLTVQLHGRTGRSAILSRLSLLHRLYFCTCLPGIAAACGLHTASTVSGLVGLYLQDARRWSLYFWVQPCATPPILGPPFPSDIGQVWSCHSTIVEAGH
jgi:hypothetical protein